MTPRIGHTPNVPGLGVALGAATVALGAAARIALARVALSFMPSVAGPVEHGPARKRGVPTTSNSERGRRDSSRHARMTL